MRHHRTRIEEVHITSIRLTHRPELWLGFSSRSYLKSNDKLTFISNDTVPSESPSLPLSKQPPLFHPQSGLARLGMLHIHGNLPPAPAAGLPPSGDEWPSRVISPWPSFLSRPFTSVPFLISGDPRCPSPLSRLQHSL